MLILQDPSVFTHGEDYGSTWQDMAVLVGLIVVGLMVYGVTRGHLSEPVRRQLRVFGQFFLIGFALSFWIPGLSYVGCAVGGLLVAALSLAPVSLAWFRDRSPEKPQ